MTATNGTQSAISIAAGAAGNGINFGTSEGHIIVTNTAGGSIAPVIMGSNGLTISGNNNINANTLGQLSGGGLTLSGTNTFTGMVTINGRLVINNGTGDTPLGDAANPVQFSGGTLVFNNSGTTLAATRTVTMLPNSFGVIDTNNNPNTIASKITGGGGLVKISGGVLTLSNATNDYSGPTTIFAGSVVTNTLPQGNYTLSSLAANTLTFAQTMDGAYLGNISGIGSVQINNTGATPITITLGDPSDATKGVNSYGGGTTFANNNPVTLRGTTSSLVGGIVTQTNDSIVYEQNFDGTVGSLISGPTSVTKLGTGNITVVNNNTYSGATIINGGTLSISSAGNLGDASATNTISVSNGSTLRATATVGIGTTRTLAIGSGGAKLSVPDVNHELTVSGAISGAAGNTLTKTGFGKVTLSATNTYAGATNVEEGTLAIAATGSIGSSAGVNVAPGADFDVSALVGGYAVPAAAFLSDNGTVTGNVVSAGTVSGGGEITGNLTINNGGLLGPGNSPGNITVDGLTTFNAGSIFSLELTGGAPGTGYDVLTAGTGGGVTISGGQITLSLGFTPAFGQQFKVIDNLSVGAISGVFANLADEGIITAGGYDFVADYQGGDGNDLVLTVPEPTSATVLTAGLGLLAGLRRFRRRSASV
jgi:fibronectin-binding autotransporter adhesin